MAGREYSNNASNPNRILPVTVKDRATGKENVRSGVDIEGNNRLSAGMEASGRHLSDKVLKANIDRSSRSPVGKFPGIDSALNSGDRITAIKRKRRRK